MFNYKKVRRLESELRDCKNDLERKGSWALSISTSLSRYVRLANLIGKYSHLPYISYENLLNAESDVLELEAKNQAERAKIESIVRDLLKKNVFKEVKK